jgi:hypothetical protein
MHHTASNVLLLAGLQGAMEVMRIEDQPAYARQVGVSIQSIHWVMKSAGNSCVWLCPLCLSSASVHACVNWCFHLPFECQNASSRLSGVCSEIQSSCVHVWVFMLLQRHQLEMTLLFLNCLGFCELLQA